MKELFLGFDSVNRQICGYNYDNDGIGGKCDYLVNIKVGLILV